MEKLGYGPDKDLAVTVSTRNLAPCRDPAVILIDQLKQIYMDGVLDPVDTTNWYPKVMRKDYTVGLNITETAVDDPDPALGSSRRTLPRWRRRARGGRHDAGQSSPPDGTASRGKPPPDKQRPNDSSLCARAVCFGPRPCSRDWAASVGNLANGNNRH